VGILAQKAGVKLVTDPDSETLPEADGNTESR
jgi:hypothetical protein